MSRNGRSSAKASRIFLYVFGTVAIVALALMCAINWDSIVDLFKTTEEVIENSSDVVAALSFI